MFINASHDRNVVEDEWVSNPALKLLLFDCTMQKVRMQGIVFVANLANN